jgi:hypothetical protein
MKHETNRVLGRTGARELTPEEVARVSGGRGALSATTNVATAILSSTPDVPETDDIDS